MKKILFVFVTLLCLSCKDDKTTESSLNSANDFKLGTQQVIDSISKIKKFVDYRNHPHATSEKLKLIEADIKKAKAAGTLEINFYFTYAATLLNAGETEKAIGVLNEIQQYETSLNTISEKSKIFHELKAIAYMRLGEQTNCIENHSVESCLFPIKGQGVHKNRMGSSKAIEIYNQILEKFPQDLQSIWLMNLAYLTIGEYPDQVPQKFLIEADVFESEYNKIGNFENVSMFLGLDINDLAGGIIADDFNDDGNLDLLVSSWGLFGKLLYFESDGSGSYNNKTTEAGLEGVTGGLNLIQGDYNNDGYLDAYVIRGAWSGYAPTGQMPNSLLKNNGNGTFSDVTIEAGIYKTSATQAAVFADFNMDGWLDLFVGNETVENLVVNESQFLINQKDGSFKDMAAELGLDITVLVKGVTAGDYNNDGTPDLYISVLKGNNLLFKNNLNQTNDWNFEEVAAMAKVQEPFESFPTWFFDYNNDGYEDLFVASYDQYAFSQQSGEVAADYLGLPFKSDIPRLYKNNGDGTFEDVTSSTSLDHVLHAMGCNFGDIDNDGFIDFYIGTGAPDFRSIVPNRMFRNNKGETFQDVTSVGNFGHIQKGHGVAFADFNNDGDQDIYAVMGGSVSGDIFQNALFENPGNLNKSITIRLEGTKSNRSAIGAKIKLTVKDSSGNITEIYNVRSSGGSFGANSLQSEIGLAEAIRIEKIEIDWPDKISGYIDYGGLDIKNHQIIKITEGSPRIERLSINKFDFVKKHNMSEHH